MSESNSKSKRGIGHWYLIIAAVAIFNGIVFFALGFSYRWFFFDTEDLKKSPEFGDSFGMVNAFFSAFGLTFVAAAVLIQIYEYKLARDEREDALATQQAIARQQEFANIVSAIGNWSTLVADFQIRNALYLTETELQVACDRFVNAAILGSVKQFLLLDTDVDPSVVNSSVQVLSAKERAEAVKKYGEFVISLRPEKKKGYLFHLTENDLDVLIDRCLRFASDNEENESERMMAEIMRRTVAETKEKQEGMRRAAKLKAKTDPARAQVNKMTTVSGNLNYLLSGVIVNMLGHLDTRQAPGSGKWYT